MTAPDAATIKAHGQAPGSAVDADRPDAPLRRRGRRHEMDWEAEVNIAGTLASVGARMIEGTATKMIGQTFDCMKSKLEATTTLGRSRAARRRHAPSGHADSCRPGSTTQRARWRGRSRRCARSSRSQFG